MFQNDKFQQIPSREVEDECIVSKKTKKVLDIKFHTRNVIKQKKWALIFTFRLRFPLGVSIATFLKRRTFRKVLIYAIDNVSDVSTYDAVTLYHISTHIPVSFIWPY